MRLSWRLQLHSIKWHMIKKKWRRMVETVPSILDFFQISGVLAMLIFMLTGMPDMGFSLTS